MPSWRCPYTFFAILCPLYSPPSPQACLYMTSLPCLGPRPRPRLSSPCKFCFPSRLSLLRFCVFLLFLHFLFSPASSFMFPTFCFLFAVLFVSAFLITLFSINAGVGLLVCSLVFFLTTPLLRSFFNCSFILPASFSPSFPHFEISQSSSYKMSNNSCWSRLAQSFVKMSVSRQF